MRDRIANYRLLSRIGNGSFGKVYLCCEVSAPGHLIALKVEKKNKGHFVKEASLFNALEGCEGFPRLYKHDYDPDIKCRYLAMELLGPSIEDLFILCKRKFRISTIGYLAIQMVERLQQVHDKGIIHRDMKPHNFMIGRGAKKSTVYLGDFGLAKFYLKKEGHLQYKEGKYCVGTARYVSINDHLGIQQSRRDDLESLGYVLIYLARGELPWQGLHSNAQNTRKEQVAKMKISMPVVKLCEGLSEQFAQFIDYTRALKFEQTPDYGYLKNLLFSMIRGSENESILLDWE